MERAGQATYHGPGQLVCYPIMDLTYFQKDINWYLRSLEQTIIDTLTAFDIGFRDPIPLSACLYVIFIKIRIYDIYIYIMFSDENALYIHLFFRSVVWYSLKTH